MGHGRLRVEVFQQDLNIRGSLAPVPLRRMFPGTYNQK
jgi:hypothetical protein